MIIAGLALEGMAAHVMPAVTALSEHCASQIDANGGIPSRNPEELLTVFTLITWAHQALSTAGQTPEDADKSKLDGHLKRQNGALPFVIRFHLHPDVDATVDLGGTAVSMILKSGEVWIFRCDATAPLALEPSVYLESGRIEPRATQQVVLSAAAIDYASRVRWSLVKAQDTPDALRDLVPNDLAGSYQSTSRGTS